MTASHRLPAGVGVAETGPAAPSPDVPRQLVVGISGVRRNAAVAAGQGRTLVAFCEQERVTRVRGVRLESKSVPGEALALVLKLAGERRLSDITTYAVAEEAAALSASLPITRVDHHEAHAASAYYTSPFERAAVLVCDQHSEAGCSTWIADGQRFWRSPSGFAAAGLASLYSECAQVLGFAPGEEHRLEALARLEPGADADRFESLFFRVDGRLQACARWKAILSEWLAGRNSDHALRLRARVASGFQRYLGRMLLEAIADVRVNTGMRHLCLAGGLFYNTYFNTLIRQSNVFDDVFVPPNPGNAGLACGAALLAGSDNGIRAPTTVSPFLGPEYGPEEIKATLENCKLSYEYLSEAQVIAATAEALRRGQLVGWFQGRMEWGHRALGNRSILASPLSPYVLDNLNLFLKQREWHRTYGLSVPEKEAARLFLGPPRSRFMEYDYEIADREQFRHVLPNGATTLRVQTIPEGDKAFGRYRLLHDVFGAATGVPVLVNTSFNGFLEPIVCSPRDAIRVFFGTGLDMLVLDRFILRK
jgi:carbamoyltransferase